jgi:hypothetical protein
VIHRTKARRKEHEKAIPPDRGGWRAQGDQTNRAMVRENTSGHEGPTSPRSGGGRCILARASGIEPVAPFTQSSSANTGNTGLERDKGDALLATNFSVATECS